MKKLLENHIESIVTAVNVSDKIKKITVFNCKKDKIPEHFNSLLLTHEFLVQLYCCIDEKLFVQNKIQQFIKKEVNTLDLSDLTYLYWFEGDEILLNFDQSIKTNKDKISENISRDSIEKLKSNTHLPNWLDKFLFDNLGAKYAPDYERFDYNLDLNDEEIKVYLGTYFPRSYSESFCIFDNLFQNKNYLNQAKKQEINILDIGSGTGGDLIGLLICINKYGLTSKTINIYSIDGSNKAIEKQKLIIDEFTNYSNYKINLNIINQTIESIKDFNLGNFNVEFDFILCFKTICEIINKGKGINDNAYYEISKTCLPLLSSSGIFLLLDVTTKANHTNVYNPILMNLQINQIIKETNKYKTLVPICCNQFEAVCSEICFTQRVFKVTHNQKNENLSKIAYRIMANAEFVNSIILTDKLEKYVIRFDINQQDAFCSKSSGINLLDAYKL